MHPIHECHLSICQTCIIPRQHFHLRFPLALLCPPLLSHAPLSIATSLRTIAMNNPPTTNRLPQPPPCPLCPPARHPSALSRPLPLRKQRRFARSSCAPRFCPEHHALRATLAALLFRGRGGMRRVCWRTQRPRGKATGVLVSAEVRVGGTGSVDRMMENLAISEEEKRSVVRIPFGGDADEREKGVVLEPGDRTGL